MSCQTARSDETVQPHAGLTCKCDIQGFKTAVIEQGLMRALFLKQALIDSNTLIKLKCLLVDSYVFALAITCNFLCYLLMTGFTVFFFLLAIKSFHQSNTICNSFQFSKMCF